MNFVSGFRVRRLGQAGTTVTHHPDLVSAFKQIKVWQGDYKTKRISLVRTQVEAAHLSYPW